MMGKTHITVGATMAVAYALQTGMDYRQTAVMTGIVAFGSLFPDIDHPSSILGRPLYPISKIINKLFGHRGVTHSLILYVAVGLVSYFIFPLYWPITCAFLFGVLSHIIMDFLNPGGVPLLYPLKKRFNLLRIRTGSPAEYVLMLLLLALTAGLYF